MITISHMATNPILKRYLRKTPQNGCFSIERDMSP
jgi:hypothetical protein